MTITPDAIRERREALGLTQEDAARQLDVTLVCYRDWEAGKHEPTGLYRKALERWLNEEE